MLGIKWTQARCLHRSGSRFTNSSVAFANSSRPERKCYSALAGALSRHELATNPLVRSPKPWKSRQWPPPCLGDKLAPRFASTTPSPPFIAEVQSDHVPPPLQTSDPAGDEFLATSLDEVTSSVPPVAYEHLGFLKEMGLDYGWGPTAFVESLLEHVHVYLGTPWWASIGISMLIARAALLKFYINAADNSARRQTIKHLSDPIDMRIQAARAQQNQPSLQKAWSDRQILHRSAGIIWWKSLAPVVQIFLGFGTFRLMRGMSSLPVPGLDTGGFLWVFDLTQSDPYLVLPVATAAAYFITFKMGGETGSSGLLTAKMQKAFQYGLPLFGGLFMIPWPAALQLSVFISALISAVQAALFREIWFRNLVGIQPHPQPAAPKPQSQTYPRYQAPSSAPTNPGSSNGIFGTVKGAVSDIMKVGEKYSSTSRQRSHGGRLTAQEKQHAKAYEEKRQREITRDAETQRERAQTRFERDQEQATRDQEKREGLQRRAEKRAKRRQ